MLRKNDRLRMKYRLQNRDLCECCKRIEFHGEALFSCGDIKANPSFKNDKAVKCNRFKGNESLEKYWDEFRRKKKKEIMEMKQ